jgi:hypothetical protein
VETDRPGVSAAADLLPVIETDGTVARTAKRLIATIPLRIDAGTSRRFRLEPAPAGPACPTFCFQQIDDKSLRLSEGDRPVMVYNFGTVTGESVPVTDHRRNRGCFVHPLYGINGEVLTDVFPRDHYHHVGLFWAWPHVRIADQEYNLWSYSNIQQKFVRWLGRETSGAVAVLGVENGWFVGEQKVMTERVWFTVHRAIDDQRAIDVRLVLLPTDQPVTLWGAEGKSYGGLNLRYAPSVAELQARQAASAADASRKSKKAAKSPPRPKDTFITVPAGLASDDLPDTRLPWADLVREFPAAGQRSGAAIFVDPQHPDYPPTWLTRHYGILCVGWPGVNPKTIEVKKPATLDYRVWIHKTSIDVGVLQQAYEAYMSSMRAQWEK